MTTGSLTDVFASGVSVIGTVTSGIRVLCEYDVDVLVEIGHGVVEFVVAFTDGSGFLGESVLALMLTVTTMTTTVTSTVAAAAARPKYTVAPLKAK